MPNIVRFLEVWNFKSIQHLQLECRRVNVFIGEPNTGKSNLLEALGLLSFPHTGNIRDFVRMERMSDLFHECDLTGEVRVGVNSLRSEETGGQVWSPQEKSAYITLRSEGIFITGEGEDGFASVSCRWTFTHSGELKVVSASGEWPYFNPFRFYRFSPTPTFRYSPPLFLLPPRGENLPFILVAHPKVQEYASRFFERFGQRLMVKPEGGLLEVVWELKKILRSLPYSLVSDTLQRLVFHIAAIETNRDSVLIFEEPEAHAFPEYTKYLAEWIADDESNQYFISTHNPYFLISLVEKTLVEDIAVFITYLRDRQTGVRPITGESLTRLLDLEADVFFNLDLLLEEG